MILNPNGVHDRTHRLAKLLAIGPESLRRLATRRVVLEIGSDAAATEIGKLAFLTLCNLATRLGPYLPNLDIVVPAGATALGSPVYLWRGNSLEDQALRILRGAIPMEDLVRAVANRRSSYDLAVSIGASQIAADERLRLGWDGWLGIVGSSEDLPLHSDANPFGALVASAMAAARLHGIQLLSIGAKIPVPTETWRLNALTLSAGTEGSFPIEPGIHMPRSLLVGAFHNSERLIGEVHGMCLGILGA